MDYFRESGSTRHWGCFDLLRTIASLVFLVIACHVSTAGAATYASDVAALTAFRSAVASSSISASWTGTDPCGSSWLGVTCVADGVTGSMRVKTLILLGLDLVSSQLPSNLGQLTNLKKLNLSFNKGLTGNIPPSLGNLANLESLDLQACSFTGSIPSEIGNMTSLVYLLVNSNQLTGTIPWTIGKLAALAWFDIAYNSISGEFPVSPGFDTLTKLKHIHAQNNALSGAVPSEFEKMTSLIHLILQSNNLSGDLPPEIANMTSLSIISLGYNSFTSLPSSFAQLPKLNQLSAPYNKLSGNLPSITDNSALMELDLSNNNYQGAIPEGFGLGLSSLITLELGNSNLTGAIPESFAMFPKLQNLNLSSNFLNGSMPYDLNSNSSLKLIDLQYNNLTGGVALGLISNSVNFWFNGNPICKTSGENYRPCLPRVSTTSTVSTISTESMISADPLYLPCNGSTTTCGEGEILNPVNKACTCSKPFFVKFYFLSPPFKYISRGIVSAFEEYVALNLTHVFSTQTKLQITKEQVLVISNNETGLLSRPIFEVAFFSESTKSGSILSADTVDAIIQSFSGHAVLTFDDFGPLNLLSFTRPVADSSDSSHLPKLLIIVVSSLAGLLFLLAAFVLYFYFVLMPAKVEKHRRRFKLQMEKYHCQKYSLTEMLEATDNFSDSVQLGRGGFAVVYYGTNSKGEEFAVKRMTDANKAGLEMFWNEVEAISKLNHINILKLLGYCDDEEEQILVYEYCAKGTVNDHLWKLKEHEPLPFALRLRAASGVASALCYLHSQASPGLIHRDVKSDNVLLTRDYEAKLADFSLLKKLRSEGEDGEARIVAGTRGYVDPEYVRTGEVTTYSDVFSFGVVLLELLTGKPPIFIVDHETSELTALASWAPPFVKVNQAEAIYDPFLIEEGCAMEDLKSIAILATNCVERLATDRPDMTEVVNRLGRLQYKKSLASMEFTAHNPSDGIPLAGYDPNLSYASTFAGNSPSTSQMSFMTNVFEYQARD